MLHISINTLSILYGLLKYLAQLCIRIFYIFWENWDFSDFHNFVKIRREFEILCEFHILFTLVATRDESARKIITLNIPAK